MKKLLLAATALIITLTMAGQDVKSIMEKYSKASGGEKLKSYKTLIVEGTLSQMGMSMSIKMAEKRPDKIKTTIDFNGMEISTVINGDKGYMINPMMGSTEPTPIPADQIAQNRSNSMLSSNLLDQYKAGQVEYVGEGTIGGKASYKVKSTTDAGDIITYIDKETYLVNGLTMSVTQMGQTMDIEMRMTTYQEIDGVKMATKIDTYVAGTLSGTMSLTKIEFNTPVEDSLFEIK